MTGNVTVVIANKHLFAGPYVEALLVACAENFDTVTCLCMIRTEDDLPSLIEVDSRLRCVNFEALEDSTEQFHERSYRAVCRFFVRLLYRRIKHGQDQFIAVGLIASLLCIAAGIKKSRLVYYCLEIATRGFAGKMTLMLQKLAVLKSYLVVIQDRSRGKILCEQIEENRQNLNLAYQANMPICNHLDTKVSEKSYGSRLLVNSSGAVSADWAGSELLSKLKESIDSQCEFKISDRVNGEVIGPMAYYQQLTKFDIGVAFYTGTADPNIRNIGYASGKINTYLSCGLGVITNVVSPYGELLAEYQCGLVFDGTNLTEIMDFLDHCKSRRAELAERAFALANFIRSHDTRPLLINGYSKCP